MRVKIALLIAGLILILVSSGCVQQGNFMTPPDGGDNYTRPQPNTSQGYVPDISTGKGLCEQLCIDFCQKNPNTPGPRWDKLTPPGSIKNCKTILEEELSVTDLSECKECKCMCFSETNNTD